jgi:cyanophycinase-like exopeptidase
MPGVGRIVVMGSGETAPTMIKIHRQVLADSGAGPAVLLDTPFGFQNNADELVARTRGYFADSVGHQVEVATWRRADAPLVDRERSLALLGRAAWAFAGPGSPTYALRHWRGTPLPAALADVLRRGGTLVLGSAAACTAGTHAVPVYEIYKVGGDPHWVEALDLVGELAGIHAVLVPHFDNAEGGTHDTRFCYLGERRLAVLEAQLPESVGVLGVDEHTALLLDLGAGTADVAGTGTVTVRRRDGSRLLEAGTRLGLDDLAGLLRGEERFAGGGSVAQYRSVASGTGRERVVAEVSDSTGAPGATAAGTGPLSGTTRRVQPSLRGDADAARDAFDAALATRDVEGCAGAVLRLEQAMHDWSADTLQSSDGARARRLLRAMVVRLGELAEAGATDPRAVLAPFVELLLELRTAARDRRDYATSDLVRDRLARAGVEVGDTPSGPEWHWRDGRPGRGGAQPVGPSSFHPDCQDQPLTR